MLVRIVRTTLAAGRHFSTETAVKSTTSATTSSGGRNTLGRRLLSLVYAKRKAVIAINKWKEEGHRVHKYELNRIVRELRKLKRYKHALEICEWMKIQPDMKLLPGDYAIHLDLIAKIRGVASAEKFFVDLPEKMKGQAACSALLHTYVQNKLSTEAEALMKKMKESGLIKNCLPYNHMLSLYISNGELTKVPEVIQELKKNTSPDVVTFNLWLTACASENDVESAEKVFLELKKAKVDPDWVTFSVLTNLYIKEELLDKAASTMKDMEKRISRRDRVAYSSLISLHANMGDKDGVKRIWKKAKSTFNRMNDSEYTCMISSLLKLEDFKEAQHLYTEWETVSGTGDSRVPNLILAAYINKNEMDGAEKFYSRIVERGIKPSYTTWELLTWGYLKKKEMDKVLESFQKAIGSVKKWDPDDKMVKEVFKILEEDGNTEGAEQLLFTLKKAGHISTEIYNMLLRTYVQAGKMPLIVAERMASDKVELDEETQRLIKLTSKMCISEVSSNVC